MRPYTETGKVKQGKTQPCNRNLVTNKHFLTTLVTLWRELSCYHVANLLVSGLLARSARVILENRKSLALDFATRSSEETAGDSPCAFGKHTKCPATSMTFLILVEFVLKINLIFRPFFGSFEPYSPRPIKWAG